jgi:hypothetical protein
LYKRFVREIKEEAVERIRRIWVEEVWLEKRRNKGLVKERKKIKHREMIIRI